MKTLLQFSLQLLTSCLFATIAHCTAVQFPVLDMTGATNDVTINIKPVNNPVIWNGNFYWLPLNGTNVTTTNGIGQINLVPGKYNAFIVGQAQSWALNVTNSATPVSATALSRGVTFYSGVQSLTGSGGVNVTNTAPGVFNIDGSQITGGGGGVSLWTSSSAGIYFSGATGTNNGWVSTPAGIYVQ